MVITMANSASRTKGSIRSSTKSYMVIAMTRYKDIKDKHFGRLTAIEPTDLRDHRSIVWKCKCECGNIVYVPTRLLTSNNTRSCGCLQKDRAKSVITKNKTSKFINGINGALLISKIRSDNTTGVKGVTFEKNRNKYRAQITLGNKKKHLGYFDTLEDAAQARKIAEEEYFNPVIIEAYGEEKAHD